jgi:hypothetical protein
MVSCRKKERERKKARKKGRKEGRKTDILTSSHCREGLSCNENPPWERKRGFLSSCQIGASMLSVLGWRRGTRNSVMYFILMPVKP